MNEPKALPEDVVREIEKAAKEQTSHQFPDDTMLAYWKWGAKFGYKLAQAKAQGLVEALDKISDMANDPFCALRWDIEKVADKALALYCGEKAGE